MTQSLTWCLLRVVIYSKSNIRLGKVLTSAICQASHIWEGIAGTWHQKLSSWAWTKFKWKGILRICGNKPSSRCDNAVKHGRVDSVLNHLKDLILVLHLYIRLYVNCQPADGVLYSGLSQWRGWQWSRAGMWRECQKWPGAGKTSGPATSCHRVEFQTPGRPSWSPGTAGCHSLLLHSSIGDGRGGEVSACLPSEKADGLGGTLAEEEGGPCVARMGAQ